jgi:hypothetical protein
LLNSQAAESQSRAQKYQIESQLYPQELTLKYADANNDGQMDADFEKRVRMAELLLKEQELQLKQDERMESAKGKAEAELVKNLMRQDQASAQGPAQAPQSPVEGM